MAESSRGSASGGGSGSGNGSGSGSVQAIMSAIEQCATTPPSPSEHQRLFQQVLHALKSTIGPRNGLEEQMFDQAHKKRLTNGKAANWDEFHALVVKKWGKRDQGSQPQKSITEIKRRFSELNNGKYIPGMRKIGLAVDVLAYLATLLAWKSGGGAGADGGDGEAEMPLGAGAGDAAEGNTGKTTFGKKKSDQQNASSSSSSPLQGRKPSSASSLQQRKPSSTNSSWSRGHGRGHGHGHGRGRGRGNSSSSSSSSRWHRGGGSKSSSSSQSSSQSASSSDANFNKFRPHPARVAGNSRWSKLEDEVVPAELLLARDVWDADQILAKFAALKFKPTMLSESTLPIRHFENNTPTKIAQTIGDGNHVVIEVDGKLEVEAANITNWFVEHVRCRAGRPNVPTVEQKFAHTDWHRHYLDKVTAESTLEQKYKAMQQAIAKALNFKLCTTFPWSVALTIYRVFKPRRILDMCAGWGDRMLAAMKYARDVQGIGSNHNDGGVDRYRLSPSVGGVCLLGCCFGIEFVCLLSIALALMHWGGCSLWFPVQ